MADNRINFKLSSFFEGEGFNKAVSALDKTAKGVQKTSGAIAKISGELSSLGGQTGQMAGAVGELAASLANGTIAFTAISMATSACIAKFVEWRKAVAEADVASAQLNATTAGLGITTVQSYEKIQAAVERLKAIQLDKEYGTAIEMRQAEIKAVDELTKSYNSLAAAEAAVRGGEKNLAIAKITEEFNNALRNAATEIDKGVIEASKRLKLAQLDGASAVANAAAATEKERSARDDLVSKIGTQKELIDLLTKAEKDTTKETEELAKMESALNEQNLKLAAAEKNEEAERIKASTAEADATAALRKVQDAATAEAKAREEAAQELEDEAVKKQADQQEYDKLQTELTGWQNTYTDAREKIKEIDKIISGSERGAAWDNANNWGFNNQPSYNYNMDDFTDFRRSRRYDGRVERNEKAQNKMNANNPEYLRGEALANSGRSEKSMTPQERRLLKDYNDFKLKGEQKTYEQTVTEAANNIDLIRQKMDAIGLR